MKKLLYIGNKLEKHGAAPTSADTLPGLLRKEGFEIKAVSSVKNKTGRLLHMILSVLSYRKADFVLIDTYSTSNFWYAILAGRFCQFLGVNYIPILRGGNLIARLESNSIVNKNYFKNSYVNIAPSQYFKALFREYNINNVRYIPNSIDLSLYPYTKRKFIRPKILWVRAFQSIYNPDLAISIIEELLKFYPNSELCMVGPDKDGSFKRIRELSQHKNLPVIFKGKLTKEEWIRLSGNYDIFINTTSVDNTPVSVIEAMALGLPVVSTNVGGLPYLIDEGETGLLTAPGDSKAMAEAIKKLLSDPVLAEKISRNARKKVENYDWQKVKQNWLELLS